LRTSQVTESITLRTASDPASTLLQSVSKVRMMTGGTAVGTVVAGSADVGTGVLVGGTVVSLGTGVKDARISVGFLVGTAVVAGGASLVGLSGVVMLHAINSILNKAARIKARYFMSSSYKCTNATPLIIAQVCSESAHRTLRVRGS
jgi:hypothetical protein